MSRKIHTAKINMVGVFERISSVIGKTQNNKIAAALNVNPATCTNWKGRTTIPWVPLYNFAREQGISFDWLLTGEPADGGKRTFLSQEISELCDKLEELKSAGDEATIQEIQIITRTALRFAKNK